MHQSITEETSNYLIRLAKTHAYTVTKTQLARWHRAGLLPPPLGRRFLGRPLGSETIYPTGTNQQLLDLLQIHRGERRLPFVAWGLWWRGYDISIPRHILPFLGSRVLSMIEEAFRLLPAIDLDTFAATRLKSKELRRIRKRVGVSQFAKFLRLILEVAEGRVQAWPRPEDAELVERGLGLDQAREKVKSLGPWLTDQDTAQAVKAVWKLIQPNNLRDHLAQADESDLREARDEIRWFLRFLATLASAAVEVAGRGALGFRLFREIDASDPRMQGFILVAWVAMRAEDNLKEGFRRIKDAVSKLEVVVDKKPVETGGQFEVSST